MDGFADKVSFLWDNKRLGDCCRLLALILCTSGCASTYVFKPLPQDGQAVETIDNKTVLSESRGHISLTSHPVVMPLFNGSKYVGFDFTVKSDHEAATAIKHSDFRLIVQETILGEREIKPSNPDRLILGLRAQKALNTGARVLGGIVGAAAGSSTSASFSGIDSQGTLYSGTVDATDYGALGRGLSAASNHNQQESAAEANTIMVLDRNLVRDAEICCGKPKQLSAIFPYASGKVYVLKARFGDVEFSHRYSLTKY